MFSIYVVLNITCLFRPDFFTFNSNNYGSNSEGRKQIPSHYLESVTSHVSLSEATGFFSSGVLLYFSIKYV